MRTLRVTTEHTRVYYAVRGVVRYLVRVVLVLVVLLACVY